MSDRPRRRHLILPFALLAVVVVVHAIYWVVVSGQIRSSAQDWITAQESAGYTITHEGLSVAGYPFRFSLRAEAPRIAAPQAEGGWQVSLARLAATAQFYNLTHWILTPDGAAVVEAITGDGPARWRLTPRAASVSLSGSGGATTRIGATIEELVLEAEEGPAPGVEQIGALNLSGYLSADDTLALRVQADRLRFAPGMLDAGLEAAFDREAQVLRMDALVTEFAALARAGDPADWRRAGGVFDINQAQLMWGAADMSGSGRLVLDAAFLPQGRLSLVVTDPETLITALVDSGLVHDEQGDALRLAALMAPRREGGIALPLRLQDGAFFLGPARLGSFSAPREAVDGE